MHYPCNNTDHDFKEKVFAACQYLHGLVNKQNKRVFIHCSSGLVRAPTVVLAYLCIYKRIKVWRNVLQSKDFVIQNSCNAVPNTTVVDLIISENKAFQDKQVDFESEKDQRRIEIRSKYDQKARILRELALEKEERKRKEAERQRLLVSRRQEHQNTETRLEQEHQTRMSHYKREIDH